MTTSVVCVGELTLDHVIVERGEVAWDVPGGGALYSALGALIWEGHPIVVSVVGSDYPDDLLGAIESAGIDVSGVTRLDRPGLGIWLLYESDGARTQVPRSSGAQFEAVDRARVPWTKHAPTSSCGVHLAPQTVEGHIEALREVRDRGVIATLDVMVEPFIDIERYRSGEALEGATVAFMNEEEGREIWGDVDYDDLLSRLRLGTPLQALVVKQGAGGAILALDDGLIHIPALSEAPIDTTGAGDAFAGGFLATFLESHDLIDAFVAGAVSASVIVEAEGSLPVLQRMDPSEAEARKTAGAQRLRRVA